MPWKAVAAWRNIESRRGSAYRASGVDSMPGHFDGIARIGIEGPLRGAAEWCRP